MKLIINEKNGPLGLQAIPDQENGGLLVQSVEPGGPADRGRLLRGDRILEINNINLVGLSEAMIQDQVKKCMGASELRLRVIPADKKLDRKVGEMFEADEKQVGIGTKVAHVSPTRKVPGTITGNTLQAANTRKPGKRIEIILKKEGQLGLGFTVISRDNLPGVFFVRKIFPGGAAHEDGRLKTHDRLEEIDGLEVNGKSQQDVVQLLRSKPQGALVKIVVSRQVELDGIDEREIGCGSEKEEKNTPPKPPPPILPKSVLKSPSAPSVCQVLEKKQQNRSREGSLAKEETPPPNVRDRIRKFSNPVNGVVNGLEQELIDDPKYFLKDRVTMTLHIPVHDTEKAGLGISVKGKTAANMGKNTSGSIKSGSSATDGDLGIFIKNILNGGAASRDGNLRKNDQLLCVNGVSLLRKTNAQAMEILQSSIVNGGYMPGHISLTISRKREPEQAQNEQNRPTVVQMIPNEAKQNEFQKVNGQENGSRRWSNPVLDRLTGGTGSNVPRSVNPPPGLRNDSYYMATNETWSPTVNLNGSTAVLIEEDSNEPLSP